MLYKKINKLVFERFKNNSHGSDTLIMAFDDNDLEKIAKKLDTCTSEIINTISELGGKNWKIFVTKNEEIPLCYGLMAIQILCASSMEYGRYNEILEEKLEIAPHKLQGLFKKYQDELWSIARYHIESLGFKCSFPEPSTGPGRFIQYPKSQAYLNLQDLEKLSLLFIERELKANLDISLFDFIEVLGIESSKNIPADFITRHAKRVFLQQEFRQSIFQNQLYSFYLNWDGKCKEQNLSIIKDYSNRKLYYDENKGFFTFDNKKEYVINFDSDFKKHLFELSIIKKSNEVILLKRDPSWGDFEEVRKVQLGDEVMFVILKSNLLIHDFLLTTGGPKFEIVTENIFVFQLSISEDYLSILESFISNKNVSIKWIGGVKLERNTYLIGSGPQYIALENCVVLVDGKPKKLNKDEILNLQDIYDGEHTIQPLNARKINFLITKSKHETDLNGKTSGWSLKGLEHSSLEWDISGLLLRPRESTIRIRHFIDLNIGKTKELSEGNQVLSILSKQKIQKW